MFDYKIGNLYATWPRFGEPAVLYMQPTINEFHPLSRKSSHIILLYHDFKASYNSPRVRNQAK